MAGSLFITPLLVTFKLKEWFTTDDDKAEREESSGTLTYGKLLGDTKSDITFLFKHNIVYILTIGLVLLSYYLIRYILTILYITITIISIWLINLTIKVYTSLRKLSNKVIIPPVSSFSLKVRSSIKRVTDYYITLLHRSLPNRIKVILVLLIVTAGSFYFILPRLGGELIPAISQGMFYTELSLPVGTPIEQTGNIIAGFETELLELPTVSTVSSKVGGDVTGTDGQNEGPHNGKITVVLRKEGDPLKDEIATVGKIRELAQNVPGLQYSITHPTLFTYKQPIEIILKNNDLQQLKQTGLSVEEGLHTLPILTDISSTIRTGFPEVTVRFNRDKLARLGLSARDVADNIETSILGKVPTKFREGEQRIDIRVRLDEKDRLALDQLRRLVINPNQPVAITLQEVADIQVQSGPAEIKRVGGSRAVSISADVIGVDLRTATAYIEEMLQSANLMQGSDYEISGQRKEMEESLAGLKVALFLAVFLVYVVMASQFESILDPLLILSTIPFALAGMMPILLAGGITLSLMVFIGLIVLVGIMVNNSIVMVDYINKLVRDGIDVETALTTAARTRFRPVMMTTMTTVFALIPIAFGVGEGAQIQKPMAITVVSGLAVSTLVSLFIIPLLYRIIHRRSVRVDESTV